MKIKTLEGLQRAALTRRAVTVVGFPRPLAAAFVISMQARTVLGCFQRGMTLYPKAIAAAKGSS